MGNETLVARLNGIKSNAQLIGLDISLENVPRVKEDILRDFYSNNPLAYDVASGSKSYSELISIVEENFDSYLKRVLPWRRNKDYDSRVEEIVESMNSVGVCPLDYPTYMTSHYFMNSKKFNHLRREDIAVVMPGIMAATCVGFAFAFAIQKNIEQYRENVMELLPYVPLILGSITLAGFAVSTIAYALCTPYLNHYLKSNLESLKAKAEATDKFLRENYITIE